MPGEEIPAVLIRSMCGSPAVRIPGWLQNAASARAVRAQLGTEQGLGAAGSPPGMWRLFPLWMGTQTAPGAVLLTGSNGKDRNVKKALVHPAARQPSSGTWMLQG